MCLQKEERGPRIQQMRQFNLAFLGIWCSGLLMDRGGLWYIVLTTRYRETGCNALFLLKR